MTPRDVRISLEILQTINSNNDGTMSVYDYEDQTTIGDYRELPSFQDVTRSSVRNVTSERQELSLSWQGVTRLLLTIMLRSGFVLVQIGSVPVTNVNLILLQNVVDFACVTLVYMLAGYVIAYGGDRNGLIGEGRWIGHDSADKEEAIIGWQAIVISSAICTSCLVGRMHTVGYLFIGILMAGVLGPFFIHWAWTPKGWMAHSIIHNRSVAFRDYSGSTIIHIVGSLTGLMGCMILGRRILRLRDIDDASVATDSAGTAFAGYLLILLGLQSVCLPSTSETNWRTETEQISYIVVNNLLGASACSLVVVGLHFFLSKEPFHHWTVMRCVQASVAGMTIISAGVDLYTPIMCVGLGCSGGIVFYLVSRLVFQSALEDNCNIVATHLTCALVGSFAAPFCRTSNAPTYDIYAILLTVAWQVICLATIVILVMTVMAAAFMLLECLGLLRNRSEFVNHLRAVVALERGPPRSYMQRLFFPDSETVYLQPGTAPVQRLGSNVSQRFANHERALNKIEKTKTAEQSNKTTQRPLGPEIVVANAKPEIMGETRVKKYRQVHTMRSLSSIDISGSAGNREAMGDNLNVHINDKAGTNEEITKMFCSGDVADDCKAEDESSVEKLSDFNSGKIEYSAEKNLRRRQEPYHLHRTDKIMNLQLEAISEYDENVEVLVKPRPRSFSSTESESDDDLGDINCQKNLKNFGTSVKRTSECTEINLQTF